MSVKDQNLKVQNPPLRSASLASVPDSISVTAVELTAQDGAATRGLLYQPKDRRPKVGVHFMHPRTDQSTNYNILPLAHAGCAVLGRPGRWPNNDSSTTHEHLVVDMAAGIKKLRELGCEKIVLVGNSGGGTMASLYQHQASAAPGQRLTHTAAGDLYDLNSFDLPLADGIVLIAAHVGQGSLMRKMIDPAVVDENDPLATESALDMYDPCNGFIEPPASSHYDADFLRRYGEAQAARVRRIDARALFLVERAREAAEAVKKLGPAASLATQRTANAEHTMVVYRTTADPAMTDTGIEPDGRNVMTYFGGAPQIENYKASGFGRYVTARAWLSTWSVNHSPAKTILNLAKQTKPLLMVHYAGDCGTRLSEFEAIFDAAAAGDKTKKMFDGIDHYGQKIIPGGAPGPRVWEGSRAIVDWVQDRFNP